MSETNTAGTIFTPDDLLRLPDAVGYELVDGRLVERHSCMESSEVAGQILSLLGLYVWGRRAGHLFGPDAGFQCFEGAPDKVRKPDGSFIRRGRFPDERVPRGHSPIPPDLAIEVVSPGDSAWELEVKVEEYLRAGVPLIWIVYPRFRRVQVRRPRTAPQGPVSQLSEGDTIGGEDVLPGFRCMVSEFFA